MLLQGTGFPHLMPLLLQLVLMCELTNSFKKRWSKEETSHGLQQYIYLFPAHHSELGSEKCW